MIFNDQNIRNRVALAKCCYADLIIEMIEAAATGDREKQKCKMKKAVILSYAINQMCKYIEEGIYSLNQVSSTAVECFSDDVAKKFLAQMDEFCGCPCGCSPAKILDDNLPKYI